MSGPIKNRGDDLVTSQSGKVKSFFKFRKRVFRRHEKCWLMKKSKQIVLHSFFFDFPSSATISTLLYLQYDSVMIVNYFDVIEVRASDAKFGDAIA